MKIISNFRSQVALREGCSKILRTDCVVLQERLYREARKAHKIEFLDETGHGPDGNDAFGTL